MFAAARVDPQFRQEEVDVDAPSSSREKAFLLLLFLGIATLLAGLLRTRLNWRDDVPPYSRRTRALDVLLHPERYAKTEVVVGIRILNGVAATLLTGAVGVVLCELFSR